MQEPRIHKKTVQSASSTAGYVDPRNICNPGFHTVAAPTPQPFSSSSQHHISTPGNDNATPSSSKYRLEAEDDAGDCEYKWKLVGITSTRFEHLVTQMNFRISEGQGKCLYEIGVHDDGTAKGLDDADFEESVGVVKRMAGVLSLDAEIIAVQDVTPTIAELLHEQRQYLASRRTALEGLLSRNTKMMYPAGVGATSSASTSASNTNTYHQPFHFQKQYERRHEELSEALHNIVTQQAAADEQQAKVVATPPTTGTTMIPRSNSNLQQVLAAPLVQPKRMRCAEILVTRRPAQVCDVRVVMCGEEGAGKSTLVGVLTRGELDDGNGAVRSSIFSHRHELFSGKTSTIASHAIGFNAEGFITNYEEETENGPSPTNISASIAHPHEDKLVEESGRVSNTPVHHPVIVSTEEARTQFRLSHNTTTNNTSATADIGSGGGTMSDAEPTTITTATPPSTTTSLLSRTAMSLAEKSVKLVTLLDIGGSGQYSRTAFFGLTARNPGYVSLVIDVSKMINDEGGMGAFQTSSSTFTTTNQDVGAGSEEMEGGGGVDTCGGFLSEESDCTPPTTTTTAPTMTPMMKRLDSCIGQYIAICCVAKIPFFLILTKVDDVCELEMDDFLYEVDNYISAITGRFDRRYDGDGTDHRQEKEEEESAIKTLVVSVPEHLSHRDLVAGGTSSDPSRKSATETVLRAVIGCVTRSCVPVFLASSVSGAGLGALRAFFHQLPVQYGHQVSAPPLPPTLSPTTTNSSSPALTSVTAPPPPPTEILIEGAFFVPARNVGVVLAGVVLRGSVRVGQHLRLGPDRFGGFYDTTVLSIHTQPDGSYVSRLGEGSDGTFAIGHYGCDFCVSDRNGDEGVEGGLARDVATTTTPNIFELVRGGGVVDTTYAITTPTTTTNNTTNHPLSNFRSGPQDPTSSPPLHSRRGSSPTTTNTREPSTETDVSHESSGKVSCNATFVDQPPPPTANPATIRGGDANSGSHLLHPHLIRPIPSDQMPPLTACYQHHKQTSPILNNNASTKRKEALSVAHLVQTFPVSSFFFGRKGTVLVSIPTSLSPAPTATVPVAAESSTPSTATSSPAPPGLCFRFECRLHILPSPHHRRRKRRLLSKEGGRGSPHIAAENGITVGQEPVVHCRNIRQAARIDGVFAALCSQAHRTPNHMFKVCNVVCQFLYFPEVLSLGATVLLRCGQAISAVGTVVLIHPIQQGAIAPKSPTLRAARYPPPMSTSNTHLQLPLLPPPTTSLSTAPMNTNVVSLTAGSNTNTVEDPLLLEMMRMEVVEGGGDGSLSLFADDDEDKKNRKQPQSQRRQRGGVAASQAPDTSTTAAPPLFADGGDEEVGGVIDPERRRLEHECRRLSRAERRARHYALILSHKNRKEQQQDENVGKKRVSDDLEGGGSSSTATTGMGGRYCSNYSYYSSTATATPPPTPDTTGGSGGTWANYHHPSWQNNPRRGENRGPSPPITTTSTPSTTTTARGADVGTGGSSSGMMISLTMTASPPQSPDVGGAKASFNMMTGNQPTAEFLCQTDDDDVDMM